MGYTVGLIGLFLVIMSLVAIYSRIERWKSKDMNDKEYADMEKAVQHHRKMLLIYAVAFVVGLVMLFV